MGSSIGKILGTIAPIAAAFIPGIGPLAAAAIGAGSGLISGGGLKGALLGGVTGGLGAGLGSQIGGSILGEAASEAGSRALGGALTGGVAGLASGGDAKSALLGAGLGGAGGYALGGGLNDTILGRTVSGIGDSIDSGSNSLGLGSIFGSSNTPTTATMSGGMSLPGGGTAPGSYGIGSGNGLQSLTTGSSGVASGGGLSSYAIPALGAANSLYANSEAQDKLKDATTAANDQLNPYLQNGAAASDKAAGFLGLNGQPASADEILSASPGYQFAQQQGEQALARKQAAAGGAFSGAALKDAATFNNGLSQQAANDYYAKLAQQSGQGLSAAGTYGTNTTALGTAGAAADISTGNTISQLLSGVGKRFIGYDANNRPMYA